MKFSIITVCRNSAATLRATMQSLAEQTCRDYEWVVVDGASTDDTLSLISTFEGPRGTWISKPDKGIYNAMNKAARLARGDYVYFLNSDDCLIDHAVLADVAAELEARAAPDLIYGNVIYLHPAHRVLRKFEHISTATLPFEDLCHQASFARRALFDSIGPFNERFSTNADYDWLLRVFASGATTHWMDRTVAEFRTGGAHMQNFSAAVEERRAVRLQYMSPLTLALGDLGRRLRHRWHLLKTGQRPGQYAVNELNVHKEGERDGA